MNTLKERMEEFSQETGWDVGKIAAEAGVSSSAVSQWFGKGSKVINSIGIAPATRLEKASGFRAMWLSKGELPKYADVVWQDEEIKNEFLKAINLTNNPEYPSIRRVAIKAQAGVSGYAVEYMNDDGPPIVFRRDWYTMHNYQPEKMLALRVAGESMVPSLYAGDLIVVNSAQVEPKDGIAFVVAYEGEITVKRMVRDDGLWWLSSDNQDQRRYPRKKCNGETQIIGEVVYRQTERI